MVGETGYFVSSKFIKQLGAEVILDISRGLKTLCTLVVACGLSSCFTSKNELIPISEAVDPMGRVSFLRFYDDLVAVRPARPVVDRAQFCLHAAPVHRAASPSAHSRFE